MRRLTNTTTLERFVRVIGCLTLLAIGVSGAVSFFRFARHSAYEETFGFSAYYTASRLAVLREATGSFQDLKWFEAQTRRYGFKRTDVYYGNPPSGALVMAPLALLSPESARVAWIWLSVAFWMAGIALLGFTSVPLSRTSAPVMIPALLCFAVLFAPAKANLEVGQLYMFAFFLQSMCCILWLTRRPLGAGTMAGALLAFKGYGLFLILLALFRRDKRFLAGAAGSFLILAVIAAGLVGMRQWIDLAGTYTNSQFSGIPIPALQTLKSFLIIALHLPTYESGPLHFVVRPADFALNCAEGIAALFLLLWLAEFRPRRFPSGTQMPPPSPRVLGSCVLMGLVFSPRAEDHGYTLAMTAVLLALPLLRKLDAVSFLMILGVPLLAWPFHLQERPAVAGWNLIGDFARLWGAVVMLAAFLSADYRMRRRAPEQQQQQTAAISILRGTWAGAYLAALVGIGLTLWLVKPWRNPMKNGPLLAVSRTDSHAVTLLRLDLEERELTTLPVSACKGPVELSFLRHESLYATCRDTSAVEVLNLARSNRFVDAATTQVTAAARRREGVVPGAPEDLPLTSAGDRLLAANFRSNTVSEIDTASKRELHRIPVCQGPTDIAVASRRGVKLAFVSCYTAGAVSLIDINRNQEIQRILVGDKPFGIAASEHTGRVYVCAGGSNRLVILELAAPSRILRRIKLDGNPQQIALAE